MIKEFLTDETGQDMVEFSLLLVLIGAAALFALTSMGQSVTAIFGKLNSRLSSATQALDAGAGAE